MRRTLISILPVLADFANGIFATLIAGVITDTEVVWWHVLIGIPLAMLPDLDAVPQLLRRGRVSTCVEHPQDHREGLHYPFVFLVVAVGIVLVEPFYGWLFLCATMLHFANDTYGTGWGVSWLWPLSNSRYKLLGRKVNRLKYILVKDGDWQRLPDGERRLRFVVSWGKDELRRYIRQWGIDEWVEPCYLRMNWIASTEYTLFVFSLILAALTLI